MAKKNDIVNEIVWYDPSKDLHPVEQYGFVDLSEVFQTGNISGDLDAGLENYNDIEDPDSIIDKADDIFTLYRQVDEINSFTPKDAENSGKIAE